MSEHGVVCRQSIQRCLAAIPGVFAAIVLLGWAMDDTAMVRLWLSPVSMNPASAVALLCLSLGLTLRSETAGATQLVVQMVAAHLRACVRPRDVVARLGGDEFTMLLDMVHSAEDAMRVAERVVCGMPKQISIGGRKAEVGISVGIVVSEPRHVSLDAMLSEADQALYTAKQSGRGRFMVYVPELAVA